MLNVARALLFQASLPTKFWGECVLTAAHLINEKPTKLLNGKTPYEVLYHQKPSYDSSKVFGTLCFAQNKRSRDKLAPRERKCVFLGYPFGQKGWKVFNLETQELFASWNVILHENVSLYEQNTSQTSPFPCL